MSRYFYELVTVEVNGEPDIEELLRAMKDRALRGGLGLKVSTAYKNVWIAVTGETDVAETAVQLKKQFPKNFGEL